MNSVLIRNAEVVFPESISRSTILIDSGKIVDINASNLTSADEIIDADGLYLFPGLVDDQVHFREPGLIHKEDLRTASHACAAGGVTSFLEMPNTIPSATTVETLEHKYELAAEKSLVNFGFYMGATSDNVDDLNAATNIPGIKIFIGSSTGNLLVDQQSALEKIFAETTFPICAHCEDESTIRANRSQIGETNRVEDHSRIRDVNAAIVATKRAIDLATRHQHRFHVLHVSTADELPLIAQAKPWVTAEVCPHHLFFSTDDYERLGTRIQMNPSIKPASHPPKLWQALLDGTIQVVATDHAPHTLEEKAAPYPKSPSGLPAVENYFSLILHHAIEQSVPFNQIAAWCCDAPARVWGLVGKGRIAAGYDADLVLVDINRERTIRDEEQFTKCKWSPWNGTRTCGWPVRTLIAGRTVFELLPDRTVGTIFDSNRGSRLRCDHLRGGYWATTDGIGPG